MAHQINDTEEIVVVVVLVSVHPGLQRPKVVAHVQPPRRLDTRQQARHHTVELCMICRFETYASRPRALLALLEPQ
jgi:hypothetical protein